MNRQQASLFSYFSNVTEQADSPNAPAAVADVSVPDSVIQKPEEDEEARTVARVDLPASHINSTEEATRSRPNGARLDFSTVPHLPTLSITAVETAHIPALKRLTATLLPVKYPDSFFVGAVEDAVTADFSRVALLDSMPIGWIRSRLDPLPDENTSWHETDAPSGQVYIQALCLLAPFRGQGVASALLQAVLQPESLQRHKVGSIYAHVWENNMDALEWYDKRNFKKEIMVDDYYRKLRPKGAWLVRRDLR